MCHKCDLKQNEKKREYNNSMTIKKCINFIRKHLNPEKQCTKGSKRHFHSFK